jgi:hypothetical protein
VSGTNYKKGGNYMDKKRIVVMCIAVICLPSVVSLYADPTWKQKARHADKNHDGITTKKEVIADKVWEKSQRANVNTPLEAKHDLNKNGEIDQSEANAYLKDRYILISTKGRARVNTAIEKQYDTNNDGFIDKAEAEAFK